MIILSIFFYPKHYFQQISKLKQWWWLGRSVQFIVILPGAIGYPAQPLLKTTLHYSRKAKRPERSCFLIALPKLHRHNKQLTGENPPKIIRVLSLCFIVLKLVTIISSHFDCGALKTECRPLSYKEVTAKWTGIKFTIKEGERRGEKEEGERERI